MRIAHFSDIHFFQLCWNPLQIFGKQFLGNINYYFRRRRIHNQALPYHLIETLHALKVTHLIITGDFTCISSRREFLKMQNYIQLLKNEGFTVFTLPGNHDSYTKASERKRSFYHYLSHLVDFKGHAHMNLIDHRVAAYQLLNKWWLVCVDAAHATPYAKSTGVFAPHTEDNLRKLISSLPKDASLIVASHFPYDETRPKALLERGEHLKDIVINTPNIRIFMHGHRHHHRIEELDQGKLLLDSGSISLASTSSFNVLDLEKESCIVTDYHFENSTWERGYVQKTILR